MTGTLNRFIVRCSESWWKMLLLFAGQMACLVALNRITARFPSVADGAVPFDMQNTLTATDIPLQLAGYSDEAFRLYYLFQGVDFLFPLFAGLFVAAVFAFGLRHAAPAWYEFARARNLLVLLLAATLFDYLENIHLLWVVLSWPEVSDTAAQLAVLAKRGKLACLMLAGTATAMVLFVALLCRGAERLRA